VDGEHTSDYHQTEIGPVRNEKEIADENAGHKNEQEMDAKVRDSASIFRINRHFSAGEIISEFTNSEGSEISVSDLVTLFL
jgi:hypothetical protein